MALVHKKQGRVGNSIGERRELQRNQTSTVKSQKVAPKPLDKFAGVTSKKHKVAAGLAGFEANATYRRARQFNAKGVPYKRAIPHAIEQGTLRAAKDVVAKPPSDNAILKFLDRVIEASPENPRIARNRAMKNAVNAKTQAQPIQRTHRQAVANSKEQAKKA